MSENEGFGVICFLKNKVNGKMYIMYREWREYFLSSVLINLENRKFFKQNRLLQEEWIQFGKENFETGILAEVETDRKKWAPLKLHYIKIFNTLNPDNGYNCQRSWENIGVQRKNHRIRHRESNNKRQRIYYQKNKKVISEKNKEYYKKNKSNIQVKRKNYQRKNKEKLQHRSKEYQKKNRNVLLRKMKIYREKNKEKMNEQNRIYRQKNKDKVSAYAKRYREKNKEQLRIKARLYYLKNKKDRGKNGTDCL